MPRYTKDEHRRLKNPSIRDEYGKVVWTKRNLKLMLDIKRTLLASGGATGVWDISEQVIAFLQDESRKTGISLKNSDLWFNGASVGRCLYLFHKTFEYEKYPRFDFFINKGKGGRNPSGELRFQVLLLGVSHEKSDLAIHEDADDYQNDIELTKTNDRWYYLKSKRRSMKTHLESLELELEISDTRGAAIRTQIHAERRRIALGLERPSEGISEVLKTDPHEPAPVRPVRARF